MSAVCIHFMTCHVEQTPRFDESSANNSFFLVVEGELFVKEGLAGHSRLQSLVSLVLQAVHVSFNL